MSVSLPQIVALQHFSARKFVTLLVSDGLLQAMTTGNPSSTVERERPVNTRQFCEYFQISMRTAANWRDAGRIPFLRINSRNIRYKLSECERALAK